MSAKYTIITFSPVQGFIEKSRKLLDLYGSSFILSYLTHSLCNQAETREGCELISPVSVNVAQGVPNLIIIAGDFPEAEAKDTFHATWRTIVQSCRQWVEKNLSQYNYSWSREWQAWENHAWEFFWGQGDNMAEARAAMGKRKAARNWVGVNWQGESSTLSGADGIAWYGMSSKEGPKKRNMQEDNLKIRDFYQNLSRIIGGESIITEKEQLSIPELIKRLIIIEEICTEVPKISFKDVNHHQ